MSFLGTIDYVTSHSALLNVKHQCTFEKINNQQLQEMCQLCLQQFNSCMFYTETKQSEAAAAKEDALAYLSDELVFKLTLIILMTVEQLKLKKLPNQQHQHNKPQLNVYFTFVVFALIFFSHVVNHTIIRLNESLMSSHTNRILEKVRLNEPDDDDDETDKNQQVVLTKLFSRKASK